MIVIVVAATAIERAAPLHFLAGYRKRRLNQAVSVLISGGPIGAAIIGWYLSLVSLSNV